MNIESRFRKRYQYILLQVGTLPLAPSGSYTASIEHRCTSILIWPEHESLSADNTLITDPCFTAEGYALAVEQLERLHTSFLEIGYTFVTHPHRDHRSNLAYYLGQTPAQRLRADKPECFDSIVMFPYPGHAPLQRGLLFRSVASHNICVTGDAVLSLEWLTAWKYYWPNFYQSPEIIQTWESVAQILAFADVIIPGHGQPIQVTTALLQELLETFPQAAYASECRATVEQAIRSRLTQKTLR